MQYNTQNSPIEIAEYGRNIQQLLLRANAIADGEERLAYTEKVLDTMAIINKQTNETEDYRSKLWSHAFRITNYTLDVVPPQGIVLDAQTDFFHKRPEAIHYPKNLVRFRHYGANVERLVAKAVAATDAEIRAQYTKVIATFMKMAQTTYNKDSASDDIIRRDLHEMSGGLLALDGDATIETIPRHRRPATPSLC